MIPSILQPSGYYASTPAGHGARQAPSRLTSKRRYRLREQGEIPPVEYRTLDEVVEALA